jgi:hypothetical protein
VTATTDLAPALAALSPPQLERALVRRFIRATIGGLGTPLVTDHPVHAARTVMSLVLCVTGAEDEGGDCEGWPPGEGLVMGMDDVLFWACPNKAHSAVVADGTLRRCGVCGITSGDTRRLTDQARADQRERDVQRLWGAARAGVTLVPAHALRAAADFLAAVPLGD